jgi:hypothetical protein
MTDHLSRTERSVWKFEIPVQDEFTVEMPMLATVVHVAAQNDKPCMWALVNPANERVERTFYVHATGHPVRPELVHLGTFILFGGTFVGHLFEHAAGRFFDA